VLGRKRGVRDRTKHGLAWKIVLAQKVQQGQ